MAWKKNVTEKLKFVLGFVCFVQYRVGLIIYQSSPCFTCLQYKYFETTVGKGEIARNKHFLLFPQCFLPI